MNQKINDAINKQINEELFSSYLYLSMAAWFDTTGMSGFANWMRIQAQEEVSHAMKFFDFVGERGGSVILEAIEKPESKFDSPLAIFEAALEHEQHVTACINSLYELATEEKDYAFVSFLKWFIDEQVEEEASASEIIDRLKMAGETGPGVFMLDKELGARTFVPETTE